MLDRCRLCLARAVAAVVCGTLCAVLCGPMAGPVAHAQDSARTKPRMEFGIEPAVLMTLPLGTLESINGSTPCAIGFAGVTSVNAGFGAQANYVFAADTAATGIRLRAICGALGYDDLSSTFESTDETYETFDDVAGRYTVARTGYTAAYTLAYLRAAVQADFLLAPRLIARIGPTFSLPLSGSSTETIAVLAPSNATFLDHTQERTIAEGTGTLAGLGMRLGIGASVAYRLPLGRTLYFEPNVGLDYGLTSVQPAWSPLLVRGGISVVYSPLPAVLPPPVIAVTPPPEDTATQPQARPFAADVAMDVLADRLPIELRRQIVARYVPMLPTVFFDRNSPALAARYQQLSAADARRAPLDEQRLPSDAERAHYQTLNVFASRMLAIPKARVTITGTTSRDEQDRPALAAARAQAVAAYLQNVWGIQPERIAVRSRVDPALPSNSEMAEGLQENRRVELEFSDDAIYHPLQLRSVEPMTEPSRIPFGLRARSASRIDTWHADITIGGNGVAPTTRTFEGTALPPDTVVWDLNNETREAMMLAGTVRYSLTVADSAGRTARTPARSLPLRVDTTISVASSPNQPDNSAEFLLVTFDFDRADLTRRGRLELKTILDRIGPASTVSITGYTDPVGETEHNRQLALERAKRVAALMPAGSRVEYRGALPTEAPYSSTSPEGRFLSRTVRVIITNPK